eukprot:c19442_g2_i1 orf=270-533(-)
MLAFSYGVFEHHYCGEMGSSCTVLCTLPFHSCFVFGFCKLPWSLSPVCQILYIYPCLSLVSMFTCTASVNNIMKHLLSVLKGFPILS